MTSQVFYSRVPRAGGFMVSEAVRFRSRDTITIAASATNGTLSTTGNITNGSNQLTNLANVGGLRPGFVYGVSGTGIPAGTTFTYEGGNSATMSAAATATTTGVTVAITQQGGVSGKLFAGTVLGKITASGKYTAYNPGASDGSQTVAGILWDDADATAGDVQAAAVTRDAEVNAAELQWFLGASGAQQTAGIAGLAALGIIARTAV